MKKTIVLFFVLLLAGCGLELFDNVKYDDVYLGLPVVKTIGEAWMISGAVRYVSDPGEDTWKEPRDTYRDMTGDCEDMSALLLAIVINSRLGNGCIAAIKREGSDAYHAVAEINGILYESAIPGAYWPLSTVVWYRYTMDEYIQHKALAEGGS